MNLIKWEDVKETKNQYTFSYWNSIENEKTKPWWIENETQISKLTDYLTQSGLLEEFELFINNSKNKNLIKGNILDVAAGVCWTSALLSKIETVEKIDALEFSYHRINQLAPIVIKGLNGEIEKIRRIFGSFYNIKAENKYNLIFMSQAFHHADNPLKLLIECDKNLAPNGSIVLIGEHLITPVRYFKHILGTLIRERKLSINFYEIFKPEPELGDHYYRLSDYQFMFNSLGYKFCYQKSTIRNSIIIIAHKQS